MVVRLATNVASGARPVVRAKGTKAMQCPTDAMCQERSLANLKAERLGRTSVSPLEVPNVFDIRLAANGKPGCFEPSDAQLKLVRRHDLINLVTQVVD